MELTPGVIVASRYQLDSLLGAGGMGSVWRATDIRLKRAVALKVLHTDLRTDPSLTARFQREAELLASIEHRAIVPIYDIVALDDTDGSSRPCIVMGYVKGEPLASVIRKYGTLKLDHAVGIMRSLLEALAAAHAAGIIHRDLKPHNVVLEEVSGQTHVRLLDFGIAKSMGAAPSSASVLATQAGVLLGTPGYMSPEQMRNPTAVDARADLWAAAVCFFEMLTAQVPYPGATPVETVSRVLTQAPLQATSLNPALPRAVDEFFARAFAHELERRPRSAAEMIRLLEPLAIGREPTVPFMWPPPPGTEYGGAAVAATIASTPPGSVNAVSLTGTALQNPPPPPPGSAQGYIASVPPGGGLPSAVGMYAQQPSAPPPYGTNPALAGAPQPYVTPPPVASAPPYNPAAGPYATPAQPSGAYPTPAPVSASHAIPPTRLDPAAYNTAPPGHTPVPPSAAPAMPLHHAVPPAPVHSSSNAVILAPGTSPLSLLHQQDGGTFGAISIPTSPVPGAIQPPSTGSATDSAIRRRLGLGLGLMGAIGVMALACVAAMVAVYLYVIR